MYILVFQFISCCYEKCILQGKLVLTMNRKNMSIHRSFRSFTQNYSGAGNCFLVFQGEKKHKRDLQYISEQSQNFGKRVES